MKRSYGFHIITLLLLGLVLVLAGGCSQKKVDLKLAAAWTPKKVAVIPFIKVEADPKTRQAFSPLTGSVFNATRSEPGNAGIKVLDAALEKHLSQNTDFKLVNSTQTGMVFSRIRRDNMGDHPLKSVQQTGQKLQADGVIVGHLYRFARRVGSKWSAETPASVALDVALVRTADGAIVWKNSFDESQVALSDNIYNLGQYLKYGLSWFSAEEYAVLGLDEAMKSFPWATKAAD